MTRGTHPEGHDETTGAEKPQQSPGRLEPPNRVNGGSKRPEWRLQTTLLEAPFTKNSRDVGQCWSMLVNGFSECRTFASSEKISGERAKRAVPLLTFHFSLFTSKLCHEQVNP